MNNPAPLFHLADIAETQIGRHEVGSTNRGPEIAPYQAATTLGVPGPGDGYPWCAAFVDWCIKEAIAKNPGLFACEKSRPNTASVEEFVQWARESGQLVFSPANKNFSPRRNDIVAFLFPSGGHHIGIVAGPKRYDPDDGFFIPTVEGNTNASGSRDGGSVQKKRRELPGAVWRFIRLNENAGGAA